MIDAIYLAQIDKSKQIVLEKKAVTLEQGGLIHSKVAGRFEVPKETPKKIQTSDSLFDYIDFYGNLRLAYIDSAHKISEKPNKIEKYATSIGGEFGVNSVEYNGFMLHGALYVSQGLSFLNPKKEDLNEDFFGIGRNSFSYLSEASLNYNSDILEAKLGRIKVETPYANSDDIRMAPNTFEGAWAKINYTSKLNTQLIYLNRWAGYDSQDEDGQLSQDKFKDLVNSDSSGMFGGSVSYEYAKNSEVNFWYNHIDKMANIFYSEVVGIYFIDGDNLHLDYGLQASHISELDNSNIDGDVYGAMAILHYNGAFLGAAYNVSYSDSGKYITNGFGGGPYYTSLDEATISSISESFALSGISSSKNKAEAFRIGTGYEFKGLSLDGLVVEFVYGELYNDVGRIKEKDAIVTYEFSDTWKLEAIYTDYESSCEKNTFERTLVRLDYSF